MPDPPLDDTDGNLPVVERAGLARHLERNVVVGGRRGSVGLIVRP